MAAKARAQHGILEEFPAQSGNGGHPKAGFHYDRGRPQHKRIHKQNKSFDSSCAYAYVR